MVGLDNFAGDLFIAKLLDLPGELVIKHIGEPLEENQREDEVLELWRVRGSANRACRIPQTMSPTSRYQGARRPTQAYRVTAVLPSSNQERVGVLVLCFSKFNSPARDYVLAHIQQLSNTSKT